MRRACSFLLLPFVIASFGCPEQPVTPKDAGTTGATKSPPPEPPPSSLPPLPPPLASVPADPVAALGVSLQGEGDGAPAWCVQIRSVQTRLEADEVTAAIKKALEIPVLAIEADLGERGTWWRICVGDEASEAAAEARGTEWTADGAPLLKFMDALRAGDARFLVVERPAQRPRVRTPTRTLAELLLRARPDADRVPHLATAPEGGLYGGVTTTPDASGRSNILLGGPDGTPLKLSNVIPEGCASCAAALGAEPRSRRVLGGGDAGPWAGEELLLEEVADDGRSVLSVVGLSNGEIVRRAVFLLGTTTTSLKVTGDAVALDADAEEGGEVAIRRIELPIVGDKLCAVRERTEVLKLSIDGTAKRLDDGYAQAMGVAESSGGAAPTRALIAAFDSLGAFDEASRACGAYLNRGRDPGVAKTCIARVAELARRERIVAAVSAAGILSSASEAFRPAVAAPFYDAATKLDKDGRAAVGSSDCEAAPLVTGVNDKRLPHLIKLARVRLEERIDLADLADDVFLTGSRDFGPDTPVGKITDGWMKKLRRHLPARAAAIEAKMAALPPPDPAPTALPPARPSAERPGEVSTGTPSGGRIYLKVHDDDGSAEGAP
jgi:hypothetical protein